MDGKTAPTSLVLSLLIGQFSRQVQGCVESFPSIENSNTDCSNLATTCSVTCTSDHMFYDGNNRKNYICNNDNVWLPSIPKYGCLEKTSILYRILLMVWYYSWEIAYLCIDAHRQALSENQVNISQNMFRFCNSNESVKVGNIVINKFTSFSESFDIRTTIEFLITDSSTTYNAVNACVSILKDELQNGGLELHKDQLECNSGRISNISIRLQKIASEVHICNDSDVLVNSGNDTYCVPNLPVVGVKQLQYRVNISENVVLDCDILFGSPINSVDWLHGNETITTSGSLKYSGSTPNVPSLKITDATHDDSGEYICRVLNIYGTRSSHVIMLVVLSSSDVEGCVETFPSIDNSNKNCSDLTTTCAVTCTSDRIFYDGNNTKSYSCNYDNVWTPFIPKYGCLEKTSNVYSIKLKVKYVSSILGLYCIDSHQQALSENQLNMSQNVFHLCNSNGSVLVGDIVITNVTSSSSSFDIRTTIEFVITDSSTTYTAVNACVSILKDELQNGGLELHKDPLKCNNNKTSNISKPLQNITSEVHICNDSDVMVNSENDTFCVPNLPVVGIKQLQYMVNISENVVLDSDILFGSPINSVDWLHENKAITTSGSLKYSGSTPNVPSLMINDTTHDDSGKYTCRVVNRYGTQSSHTIMLVVLSSSDDAMTTQQDNSATTEISTETDNVDVSISTKNGAITETTIKTDYEKELEEDSDVYIAMGTGCSALLLLIIISIIAIKRKIFCQENDKNVYDNMLHQDIVHSDSAYDGLHPNIVDVPYGSNDAMDVYYNDVTLEPQHVDQNYCTVALDSSTTRVNNQSSQETTENPIPNNHYVNTTF